MRRGSNHHQLESLHSQRSFQPFSPHWCQKQCGWSYFFVQNIVSVHMHSPAQKGSSFIINLQGHLVLNSAETTHQLSCCLRCCSWETCYCIKIVQLKLFFCSVRYHFDQEETFLLGRNPVWRTSWRSEPWRTSSLNKPQLPGLPYAGMREHLACSHLGTVTATVPGPCGPGTVLQELDKSGSTERMNFCILPYACRFDVWNFHESIPILDFVLTCDVALDNVIVPSENKQKHVHTYTGDAAYFLSSLLPDSPSKA